MQKHWKSAVAAVLASAIGFLSVPEKAPTPRQSAQRCVPGEADGLIGLGPDGGNGGAPIPSRPAAWQQQPPCRRGEVAIRNACYMLYDSSAMMPPCDSGTYEHEGRCWRAVVATRREPTSIQR